MDNSLWGSAKAIFDNLYDVTSKMRDSAEAQHHEISDDTVHLPSVDLELPEKLNESNNAQSFQLGWVERDYVESFNPEIFQTKDISRQDARTVLQDWKDGDDARQIPQIDFFAPEEPLECRTSNERTASESVHPYDDLPACALCGTTLAHGGGSTSSAVGDEFYCGTCRSGAAFTRKELDSRDSESPEIAQALQPAQPDDNLFTNEKPIHGSQHYEQQTIISSISTSDMDIFVSEGQVDPVSRMGFDWYYDDNSSASSSYAASVASVFSEVLLASSASNLSRSSGYSAVQIAKATSKLWSVLIEDKILLSLYKGALEDLSIGPERLERNLRRLFKEYASLLENEATERLEYLASKLVFLKSSFLAQSIVEKLRSGPASRKMPHNKYQDDSSDEEEDKNPKALPINEDAFEDLVVFREFLVGSEAFRTLRTKLQAFVIPKLPTTAGKETFSNRESWVDEKASRYGIKQSTA
jgi:hypothetical protein